MNYYELLQKWVTSQPEKLFLIVDESKWSYQRFGAVVKHLVGQMSECLVKQLTGADVLLLADTFAGQLAGFLALQAVQARPILLHHGLSEREVQDILQDNHLQGLLKISGSMNPSEFTLSFEPMAQDAFQHEALDIFGVLSSGSTGTPKVMYRTYESWAGFFPVQNPIFHVSQETRLFLQGSLSFTGNLNSLLAVLYEGGSLITSETMHCRRWGKLMQKWAVDVIYLIPTKLQLLSVALKESLPQVQSLFTGSQLLTARNIRDLQRLLPQAELILYYGASELNYITYAICNEAGRDSRNLGRPFPGIGVTVHDGLIYVDTPYHVSGVKIPFSVKDTGYLNEKGELIFEGRRDAWVNKGGVKISTLRLENNLQAIAGIREAVVLPCADKLRGSTLAAFIVPDKGAEESALRREIRRSLKPVEIPSVLCFLTKMPLNDRGKVNRRTLREKLENYLTISENNSKISVS